MRPLSEPMLTIRRGRAAPAAASPGHGDQTDHVDLQLSPQIVQRDEFQRAGNGDAGVIDQSGQARVADGVADRLGGSSDLIGPALHPAAAEPREATTRS